MSSGNEKDLEEKKNLLQTEILEKNYDQIKFVEFCLSKKPNGDDLTIWSLEELKNTIQEFISQFPKPNPPDQMQNLNINNLNNYNNNTYNNFQKDIEKMNVTETSPQSPKKTQAAPKSVTSSTPTNKVKADSRDTSVRGNRRQTSWNFRRDTYVSDSRRRPQDGRDAKANRRK